MTLALLALLRARIDGDNFAESRCQYTRVRDCGKWYTPVFIPVERDYRDNPGTRSPYKHNYIITGYNDFCDNSRGLAEVKAKNPDNWNTVCGGNARDICSKQLCEERWKRRDTKREETKRVREKEIERERKREGKEREKDNMARVAG